MENDKKPKPKFKTKYLTPDELKTETEKLVDYKNELKTLYASDKGKRLYILGNGSFRVELNGVTKDHMQPFPAIEMFFES